MQVAIDTGGTFTDVILYDGKGRILSSVKVPSHPEKPEEPFVGGLLKTLKLAGKNLSQVRELIHGTTIVTNSLLEGKTAKVGLLTTQGFKDLLEIGRQQRPSLYDLTKDRLPPLVPRNLVREIKERVSSEGKIITPLNKKQALAQILALKKEKIEALAIALLFSFYNPKHERLLGKWAQEETDLRLFFLSSQISPEFREFERTSTTVIAAAVAPIALSYLQEIQLKLKNETRRPPSLRIMHSGGGTLSIDEAEGRPHALIESGPAAGLICAAHLANTLKLDKVIGFDMGGTTAKAGVILNGKLQFSPEYEVGGEFHQGGRQRGSGYPIRTPMIDVVECGAGAGSIAWIDKGKHLKVGPQSAGADPGPACYGKGGKYPTVTDAHLLLGRLSADNFLGGEIPLYPKLSQEAITQNIGIPLNIKWEKAALGILAIANASMLRILRLISIVRGHDPRDFTLIAYGGAGPLHATELAEKMAIKHIIIPCVPGLFSTLGLLYVDRNTDFVETAMKELKKPDILNRILHRLSQQANVWFLKNKVRFKEKKIQISVDLRYFHQNYELNVPVSTAVLSEHTIASLQKKFHKRHAQTYGLSAPGEKIQIVNVRLRTIKLQPKPEALHMVPKAVSSDRRKAATRAAWLNNAKENCPIYDRSRLQADERIKGPAIIEEKESTTAVGSGWHVQLDKMGNLHIRKP